MGRSAKEGGKNIDRARKLVEARPYKLEEAAELLRKAHFVKFDETVELVLNLGVDPKQSDQMVRGTVVLPNGLGKSKRVLVIASGEKVKEAQDAGADFVGGDDMVQKIQEGWTDYEAVIATPDMMKSAGRLGKVLGPRGLMPNPKTGTVTFEIARAVKKSRPVKWNFVSTRPGSSIRRWAKSVLRHSSLLETRRRCLLQSSRPSPRRRRASTSRKSRSPRPWVRASRLTTPRRTPP